MKSADIQALVEYRLERADESSQAAKIMRDNNMLTFSMNRIYYGMFYSVQALLILHGASFSKHGQVKGYFNREFIKKGIFPLEMGRTFNKVFEYRQKFDYIDFSAPSKELVIEYLEKLKEFRSKIDQYIQKEIGKLKE